MTREELRAAGAEIRRTLGLADQDGPDLAPGFGDLADEMMFGKLWARPGLALEDRMLATLAALTSRQILPQLKTYVGAALHIGMPPRLLQEVMIHCGIYAGVPSVENSLAVVNEVLHEKGRAVPGVAMPVLDLPDLMAEGQNTKRALHAERAELGYAAPEADGAAKLYVTAIQYGYGAIWGRPDMTWRQRMICTIASFTSIDSHAQCRKFFRSARNVGLSREEVHEVIMQTAPYTGFPRALNALMIADEVMAE